MNDFGFENERAWYVVQSYSGMEQAAKRNLERRIVSMNMQDYIFRVLIPETTRYEKKKNGELKEIVEKVYPGYIFVDMIVTDESWFVVRNTPMVTGFLGSSGRSARRRLLRRTPAKSPTAFRRSFFPGAAQRWQVLPLFSGYRTRA